MENTGEVNVGSCVRSWVGSTISGFVWASPGVGIISYVSCWMKVSEK